MTMKANLTLTENSMEAISQRLESLSAQGVEASKGHSGEMNFSGCASGHCQGWA